MEEEEIQSTPMGRIWMMIFISALFVFCVSLLWHFSEMHTIQVQNKKDNAKIQTNIAYLSAYRDVLKEKGKDDARAYIEQLKKTPYGI